MVQQQKNMCTKHNFILHFSYYILYIIIAMIRNSWDCAVFRVVKNYFNWIEGDRWCACNSLLSLLAVLYYCCVIISFSVSNEVCHSPCPVCFVRNFTGRFIVVIGFFTVFPVSRSYRRCDFGALAAATPMIDSACGRKLNSRYDDENDYNDFGG